LAGNIYVKNAVEEKIYRRFIRDCLSDFRRYIAQRTGSIRKCTATQTKVGAKNTYESGIISSLSITLNQYPAVQSESAQRPKEMLKPQDQAAKRVHDLTGPTYSQEQRQAQSEDNIAAT
jgi:hypothetical protein